MAAFIGVVPIICSTFGTPTFSDKVVRPIGLMHPQETWYIGLITLTLLGQIQVLMTSTEYGVEGL